MRTAQMLLAANADARTGGRHSGIANAHRKLAAVTTAEAIAAAEAWGLLARAMRG